MTEELYVEKIRETYPQLEAWQRRAARHDPEQPQRGSDLHADDRVFPSHRISEMARLSLIASGEHLRLSRDAIESGNLYGTAHFTALRGALVGASQAVWILAPDDAETRVQHGLTAVAEMYSQLEKYYGAIDSKALAENEKDELAEQLRWVGERKAQVAVKRKTQESLNLTEVIRDALVIAFTDPAKREHGRLLWRQMGSDAHALGWSLAQRRHSTSPERASGLTVLSVQGNASQIAQPFMCSFEMLKRGWSEFDRRCEAPGV